MDLQDMRVFKGCMASRGLPGGKGETALFHQITVHLLREAQSCILTDKSYWLGGVLAGGFFG
jgi:hypothetical protein